jgi:poly(beta-D-mannuronate) lyase
MLLRLSLLTCCLVVSYHLPAKTTLVKNKEELVIANKEAKPGDTIILKNGEWHNITLVLNCNGTKNLPVIFRAETAGKVLITGNSKLKIGGTHIVVDGLHFKNGYSGIESVILFRNTKDELANNCRVTNTVIDDYNNPERLNENYWIAFYGKNNRLDHCSFLNKKNLGVLLAVILEDDRSRENFHLIDHNYFGMRLPLASNGGEIIRVGVSEHCQFNSNTQISDNYFERCNGETEIISIKSGKNTVRNNVFKECQGSVVLRHGNYNTVENNIFLGNDKEGTGGVRIINKGQWVVNNLFYKCRGAGFRSPLSIMNGIPHSPANRYLEVSEAVISNNNFYECAPISFCEGSDAERTVPPYQVKFLNNLFYNSKDSQLYHAYDDISRISFAGNLVSKTIQQQLTDGFMKTPLTIATYNEIFFPASKEKQKYAIGDSLQQTAKQRLGTSLSSVPGLTDVQLLVKVKLNATNACGAKWFIRKAPLKKQVTVNCKTAAEVVQQLQLYKGYKLLIRLTGSEYTFSSPLTISADVQLTTNQKQNIKFSLPAANAPYFLQIKAGSTLTLNNLSLDLMGSSTETFIVTDTSGSSNHCNFSMNNCSIINSTTTFFNASRSSLSDSIVIVNCRFRKGRGDIFNFVEETDNKGYYNVEKFKITNCSFADYKGKIIGILRSGRDESTLGPFLVFSDNKIANCDTENDNGLITVTGVQRSIIERNNFINCNNGKKLILYEDLVRAVHLFQNNFLSASGQVATNKYVQYTANKVN